MLDRSAAVVRWVRVPPTECVEGRLIAPLHLLAHVLRDLVQRHVPGALVHHLYDDHARELRRQHTLGPFHCRQAAARTCAWIDTHLHILLPGASRQLALSEELRKLRLVVGICVWQPGPPYPACDSATSWARLVPGRRDILSSDPKPPHPQCIRAAAHRRWTGRCRRCGRSPKCRPSARMRSSPCG